MRPRRPLLASAVSLLCWPTMADRPLDDQVADAMRDVVDKEGVVGIAGAIISPDGALGVGAAGVRKDGDPTDFEADDLVHLGSCTKAMTSVLIATLVEDGTLTWETTLVEGVPQLAEEVDPSFRDVTLSELTRHTSGMPRNASSWRRRQHLPVREARLATLRDNLGVPSGERRGEHVYSNLAYMAAGVVAETACDASWEDLITERVFQPLGMTTAGFGPPSKDGRIDQPWGHPTGLLWGWRPTQLDNTPALGPAGTVHCSLEDWGRFVSLFLRKGAPLVSEEAFAALTKPDVDDYAGGWVVVDRPWAGGTAFTHAGSNTTWHAIAWVAPEIGRAYLTATNCSNSRSHRVCDGAIVRLIKIDEAARKAAE